MGVDKGSVLQEKRIFNESPINPRKCCHLITKILYLLGQGQTFTKTEATDLFFATTMLFQSTDVHPSQSASTSWRSTPSSHDCSLLLCSRSTAGELASHGLSRAQGAPAVGRRRHHRHQLPHQGHEQQDRPLQVRSRLLLLYATFHYIDLLPRLGLNATRFFWLFSSFLLFSTPLLFSGPTPSACSARSTTSPCWARPSAT